MIDKIPVAVTVSRETGQVIGAERATVEEKDFRKICQVLIGRGGEKEAEQ